MLYIRIDLIMETTKYYLSSSELITKETSEFNIFASDTFIYFVQT